ncbi:cation:proton antiporter [uncultured Enterovirga sp.]|uniref:cation:proton antiporter domain-containing protein n=1 Tax=uncultured Enterovirga sp. TaxID=2026352 RepID=UPI0035CB8138
MAEAANIGAYKEIILFLATAGIVVPLFGRFRISPVLGFIGAGALMGPFGLGRLAPSTPWLGYFTISNSDEVAHLAEFGVVFLLFTIGLELSWERLRTLRRLVFGLGSAQVILSTLALAAIGMALGLPPTVAGIGGVALALSSTAIVIPILAEQRRLNSPTGRASFSILLFQDLAVAPILFTLAALNPAKAGDDLGFGLLVALGQAAAALALIVVAGRLALRPMFQLVAQTRSPELFMAASFLIVITAAVSAASSGLSMALGAFVAGLLLAETEYRRAIEAVVEPFKGLLLGVFFLSVGMGLDVTALGRTPWAILAISVGIVVVKAALIVGLARLFRLPFRVGLESALLLGPGGEFAFVIIGAALATRILPADVGQALFVVTTVSLISIPFLARAGRKLGRRLAQAEAVLPQEAPPPSQGQVIIAGYGRVGQLVADMLQRHGVPYVALDSNPALVAAGRSASQPVYFGDSTSDAVLRAFSLDSARALVITLDQPSAIQTVVEAARRARPDLTIVARARDARHARQLYRLGVNDAVPETIEASLQLSEAVLVDIGIAMGPVIASIHERRDEFRRNLQKATEGAVDEGQARRSGEFRGRRTVGKSVN